MRALAVVCLALLALGVQARDVHGASDAFAGEGVAVVWGVLRGATEGTTQVVLRVAADPRRYSHVEVVGIDPFTRQAKTRAAKGALGVALALRLPRADFADFPRTELRFSGAESLVVYYLGVPDTTPEFVSTAALEVHLAARLARLRSEGKAP